MAIVLLAATVVSCSEEVTPEVDVVNIQDPVNSPEGDGVGGNGGEDPVHPPCWPNC